MRQFHNDNYGASHEVGPIIARQTRGTALRQCRIATKVQVIDGERKYFYWVALVNPERAKRAALRKHRDRMGLGMRVRGQYIADASLSATVVPTYGLEPALMID
jgi:hypothetical protein